MWAGIRAWSYGGDRQERIVGLSLRDAAAVSQHLLHRHKVVQHLLVFVLVHLAVAQLHNVHLLLLLAFLQRLHPLLHQGLLAALVVLGLLQVALALLLGPVAARLQLAHGVVVRRHPAALLRDLLGAFLEDLAAHGPPRDVARSVGPSLDHPLHLAAVRGRRVVGARLLALVHRQGGGAVREREGAGRGRGRGVLAPEPQPLLLLQLLLEELLLHGDCVLQVGVVGVHDVGRAHVEVLQRLGLPRQPRRPQVLRHARPRRHPPHSLPGVVAGAAPRLARRGLSLFLRVRGGVGHGGGCQTQHGVLEAFLALVAGHVQLQSKRRGSAALPARVVGTGGRLVLVALRPAARRARAGRQAGRRVAVGGGSGGGQGHAALLRPQVELFQGLHVLDAVQASAHARDDPGAALRVPDGFQPTTNTTAAAATATVAVASSGAVLLHVQRQLLGEEPLLLLEEVGLDDLLALHLDVLHLLVELRQLPLQAALRVLPAHRGSLLSRDLPLPLQQQLLLLLLLLQLLSLLQLAGHAAAVLQQVAELVALLAGDVLHVLHAQVRVVGGDGLVAVVVGAAADPSHHGQVGAEFGAGSRQAVRVEHLLQTHRGGKGLMSTDHLL